MKELLLRQSAPNAALDLNKNKTKVCHGESRTEFHSGDELFKARRGISGPRAAPLKPNPNDVPNHSFV